MRAKIRLWIQPPAAGLSSPWPPPAWPAPCRPSGAAGRSIPPVAASARPWRARVTTVSENSRPGTDGWVIHHVGAADEIMGYAGSASVAQGERFPLYVSTTADQFQVNAYRLGWYQGHGAREVWSSRTL